MEDRELLQTLAKSLGGLVQKQVSMDPYAFSERGLFGTCKQDPILVNAMVGPQGVMKVLDWVGSDVENPIYQALTYMGSTGYAQEGDCTDCGTPVIYRCAQTACFGRVCQMTEQAVVDRLGVRANFGVEGYKTLFGNITDPEGNILIGMGEEISDMFTLHVGAAGYNLRRRIGQMMWDGNPANNLGGYAEFSGFDLIINTGKVDALTGFACDALDSTLIDYESNVVGAAGSPSIVAYISGVVRSLWYRMEKGGFNRDTARMYVVMRPDIWDCVADAYACEYGLNCAVGAASRNDALEVARMRDDFKNRSFVRVDGVDIPVVIDNGIASGFTYVGDESGRCSDIYVITTHIDGRRITWGEYQDMNMTAGNVLSWFNSMFGATPVSLTDGGRYAVAPVTAGGFCFDVRILTKPRILALMPQLLGRVQNVCCLPIGTYPDVTGSGLLYEVGGGAPNTPENYLYGDCWPGHAGWPGGGR